MGARLVVAVVMVFALAGCGEDEPAAGEGESPSGSATSSATATDSESPAAPSPDPTPTIPANAPNCAEVWVDGATLPNDYRGCVVNDAYLKAEVLSCSSGQGIVRYDERFWAVRGGLIEQADDIYESDEYLASVARCRG